jgi:hypothetical protein
MNVDEKDRADGGGSEAPEEQTVAVAISAQPQPEKSGSSAGQIAGPVEPEVVVDAPALAGNPFLSLFDESRRSDRYALAIVRHSWNRAERIEQEARELRSTIEELRVALTDERLKSTRLEERLSASNAASKTANVPSVVIGPLVFSAGLYVAQTQTMPGLLVAALGVTGTIFGLWPSLFGKR